MGYDPYDEINTEDEFGADESDADILNGIEDRFEVSRSRNYRRQDTKKANPVRKQKESDAAKAPSGLQIKFNLSRKYILAGAAGIAVLVALAVGIGTYIRSHRPKQFTRSDSITEEQMKKFEAIDDVDSEVLELYRFLLDGKHEAASTETQSGVVKFNFGMDGSFSGYTSIDEDDFGTYELSSRGENVYLTIKCFEVEDEYQILLSEQNDIILLNDDQRYVLIN